MSVRECVCVCECVKCNAGIDQAVFIGLLTYMSRELATHVDSHSDPPTLLQRRSKPKLLA